MRIVIAVSLLVVAFLAVGAANLLFFRAEAELLDERLELAGKLRRNWFGTASPLEVSRLYRSEFPERRVVQNAWRCAIGGFVAGILGFFFLAAR